MFVHEDVNGVDNIFSEEYDRVVYVPDPNGDKKDIFGNPVRAMRCDYDKMKNLQKMYGSKLCESDISEEVMYIANRYHGCGVMKPDINNFNV